MEGVETPSMALWSCIRAQTSASGIARCDVTIARRDIAVAVGETRDIVTAAHACSHVPWTRSGIGHKERQNAAFRHSVLLLFACRVAGQPITYSNSTEESMVVSNSRTKKAACMHAAMGGLGSP